MDSPNFAAVAHSFRQEVGSGRREPLYELGTVLRTPEARSNPEIRSLLPAVFAAFDLHPSEVLRVFVNYVANNVSNQEEVLGSGEFWTRVLQMSPAEHVNASSVLMILINQFLRSESEDLQHVMSRLCEHGCHRWVMQYYRQLMRELEVHSLEEVDFGRPLEFVKEWSSQSPERVATNEFVDGYRRFAAMAADVADADSDDLDDWLLACTEILYNCTNVSDSNVHQLGPLVELLALGVSPKLPHMLNIRRNLFAACGNVSSYPAYDNAADAAANLRHIATSEDPYVVSACAISLGNCISSSESQRAFLAEHNAHGAVATALTKILHMSFMDVIQFQAFHFFNNVLTEELARGIMAAPNAAHLMRQTKVIADNCAYYKDVAVVYLKFLRKLTTLGFQTSPCIDFLPYREAYEYLLPVDEAAEVQHEVLQILCRQKTPLVADFKKELVEKLLKMNSTLSASVLLSKIKTLAIFIKSQSPDDVYELYGPEMADYLARLGAFVASLTGMASENNNPAEAGVVANNTKFIAISIKGHVEDLHVCRNEFGDETRAIVDACMRLLAQTK